MDKGKLNLAILWHQHQPFYKNARGIYQMPWVRFHGTKDYLDMLLVLREFPEIKQNINLVPSLLLQIEDYVRHNARDNVWFLSEKDPKELTPDEKNSILNNFFLANFRTMIRPYPRFHELFLKYRYDMRYLSDAERIKIFHDQDFRDLQVWYNLTWIGVLSRERPVFQKLFKKGRNFSEEDKKALFNESRKLLAEIIPLHRKMYESGQIELSTTPFYHPILPLLIDQSVAKESDPHTPLPETHFAHPEDAEVHVQKALEYFEKQFGRMPSGVWPAEGSVSDAAAQLISKYHIQWIATDEAILAKSRKQDFHHLQIYQPHRLQKDTHELVIFFRDHYLSDAIGFVYSSWDEDRAVEDFITRLHNIRNRIVAEKGETQLSNFVVSVILDGENCWEYYKNDGKPFLRKLYQRLSEDPLIRSTTFSEALSQIREMPSLSHVHPGSWINANFNIWIGNEEDNRAWDLLKKTRDFLVHKEKEGLASEENIAKAWEQIYIAEGSDWCWWYGDEHTSSQDMEFDQLYREHLMEVYLLLGEEVPSELFQTIKHSHFDRFRSIKPLNFIYPIIDGRSSHYYEWVGAAIYDGSKVPQTAMHQVSRILDKLYVGFDKLHLYLRVDFFGKPDPLFEYIVSIKTPRQMTVVISPLRGIVEKFEVSDGQFKKAILPPTFKLDKVLEIAIKFEDLNLNPGDKFGFQLHIKQNNQLVEIFPHINIIEVEVPDEYFELKEWSV